MGSDLHSDKHDKLLKLQARKKELELMLANKNEELYKLCVQEVQLTGVMPPEAPLSPEVPQRERLGSVRSENRSTDGNDVHDGSDNSSRRFRPGPTHESEQNLRKNLSHRLSTPSISGMSTKSHPRFIRRPETSCSNFFPSPPQERDTDTFSMHTSHTYPALATRHETVNENAPTDIHPARHHTVTTEYMNKIYYNNAPEAQHVSRLRETHFSSSHPDITTNYTHGSVSAQPPQNVMRNTPLLYQYASHLKAQSQHLGGVPHHQQMQAQTKRRPDSVRRHTLQRTQTYHLTSHSDYNQHLENMTDGYRPPLPVYQHRSHTDIQESPHRVVPLREQNSIRHPMHLQLQVSTDDYGERRGYPDAMSPVSMKSGYSNFDSVSMNKFSPLSQNELKVKEKQWYETSLDSPTRSEAPLLKKSSSLKRTSSIGNSQAYEVMISSGRHSAMQSPNQVLHSPHQMPHSPNSPRHMLHSPHSPRQVPQSPHSPRQVPQSPHSPRQAPQSPHSPRQVPQSPVMSPSGVSLDSPKNLTVIEQGKCIPYREETKPFEMSDFYKYSTKFRQPSKPAAMNPGPSVHPYNKLPMELPQYAQDHWHGQSN
ncbi:putative FERM domain containing 4A [Operophtera brumata]|uniref:Putative FERM domain containing 4A n=1 Tax=Operophtera brumata TaxID=104452 RepID=A0A0L7LEF9_OPEBR|nr:putative FERM domain containing 4A [Operophtera brumata]